MKKHIKIPPIILSIIIVFNSFLNCTFIVYASKNENFGNPYLDAAYWLMEDVSTSLIFLVNQLGAIVDHDFVSFVENLGAFDDYWNEDNITVSEDGTITFSDDLVKYIKQALKDYAEETNGFIIFPTIDYRTLEPTSFNTAYEYNIMKAMVKEYGLVGVRSQPAGSIRASLFLLDMSSYMNGTVGFYVYGDNASTYSTLALDLLSWGAVKFNYCTLASSDLNASGLDTALSSWDEIKDFCASNSSSYYYESAYPYYIYVPKPGYSFTTGNAYMVSNDGRNMLIFKSKEALQNYSVEHRSVYFGSKFYEDSGPVTGSYDDLQDWLDGKYDSLLDDLRVVIGGESVSEEELEKILDDFLDKFFERWEESGGGSGGIGGTISAALDDWLEKIYGKLKDIESVLKKIKNWTILDTLFDAADAVADWISLIHDIISDVDSGAESAIATLSSALDSSMGLMKKKFPFSVPWDILFFVTVLSAEPETPHFEVPIDFTISVLDPDNPVEIHYDFIVDFTDYQYLSDVLRTVLSMIYAVGLIKLTSGIVTTNKED